MPTGYVKKIAKAYKKKTTDVEKLWDKAKGIVVKKYKFDSDQDLPPNMWSEVTGVFKKIVKNTYGAVPKEAKDYLKL